MLKRCLTSLLSISLFALSLFPATTSLAQTAESKSQIRFYHPDHLGSSSVVTDENGQVVEYIEYKPFGEVHRREIRDPNTGELITANQASSVSPFGFTGQRFDDSTSLYFYNSRYYDPQLGHFTQADSLVQAPSDPQTLNRFSYTRNNPVKYTDPTGHSFRKELKEHLWSNPFDRYQKKSDDFEYWHLLIPGKFDPQNPADAHIVYNHVMQDFNRMLVDDFGLSQTHASAITGALMGIGGGPPGVIIGAAMGAATNEIMESRQGRRLVKNVAYFLHDTTGMDLRTAYTVASTVVAAGIASIPMAARGVYNKLVHYDVTWAKGGAAVGKEPPYRPVDGTNNVSFARESPNPNSWWDEGGRVSRLGNQVPGVNAVAGLHDNFQIGLKAVGSALQVGNTLSFALNVPGMPVSAVITYAALVAYSYGQVVGSTRASLEE